MTPLDPPPAPTQTPIDAAFVEDVGTASLLHALVAVKQEPLLQEAVRLLRELVTVGREQTDLLRKAEERAARQQAVQRDEVLRWFRDHPELVGQCQGAQETVRRLLGDSLCGLVEYLVEERETLLETEYARSDLTDRLSGPLHHLSGLYGTLRRLTAVERALQDQAARAANRQGAAEGG